MTEPCDACPFTIGSGFTWRQLVMHAKGEFGCHKTCKYSEDSGQYEPVDKTLHCAGALIFLEKQGQSHQMMRITERVGAYDRFKLNMQAPVITKPADCKKRTDSVHLEAYGKTLKKVAK